MGHRQHVDENVSLVKQAPASDTQWLKLFERGR
jgi:hypothetical protein